MYKVKKKIVEKTVDGCHHARLTRKEKFAVSERFVLNLSCKVLILKYFSTFAALHCPCYLLHTTLYILKHGQIF